MNKILSLSLLLSPVCGGIISAFSYFLVKVFIISKPLYEYFNQALENAGVHTETGIFGAMMKVSLINDGPTTIILDSKEII